MKKRRWKWSRKWREEVKEGDSSEVVTERR